MFKNGKKYICIHQDLIERKNHNGNYESGLLMSSGGIIENGVNAFQTAINESYEEQGCKIDPEKLVYLGSYDKFHYFAVEVSENDYDWNRISEKTPWEVGKDISKIPSIFGKENCIQVGGSKSAIYLVNIEKVLDKKYIKYLFPDFLNILHEFKHCL